jgi:hypothetical protein
MTAAGHTRPSKQQRSTVSMRIWARLHRTYKYVSAKWAATEQLELEAEPTTVLVLGRWAMTAWPKEEARGVVVERWSGRAWEINRNNARS